MNESLHEYLLNKHPVLKYIPLPLDLLDTQEIALLQKQIDHPRSMSAISRTAMKKVKQFAQVAKPKYKADAKLYKFLTKKVEYMQEIIISQSSISSLQAFTHPHISFPSLSQLTLSSNSIQDITPLSNSKMPCLSRLDLSSNKIQMISNLPSMGVQKLKELHLGQNRISSIQILQMCQFNELRLIDLSCNYINRVSIGKMRGVHLKELNLSSNYVTEFTHFTHRIKLSLGKLLLDGNPNPSSSFLEKLPSPVGKITVSGLSAGLSTSHFVKMRRNSMHGLGLEWKVARQGRGIIERRSLVLQ